MPAQPDDDGPIRFDRQSADAGKVLPDRAARLGDLPPEWLATLDAIAIGRRGATATARFWGSTRAMVRAGLIEQYEDDDDGGKVKWTLTPYAARMLGYVLIEADEGKPKWVRHDLDAGPYPDPPLKARLRPWEKRLPDASYLNIPDPHADPARAEARRRAMSSKARRRRRKAVWKAEKEGRAVEGEAGRAG